MPTLVEVAQELNLAQHSQRELRVKLKHASELLHGNRSSKHTVYARAACNLGGHAVRNKQRQHHSRDSPVCPSPDEPRQQVLLVDVKHLTAKRNHLGGAGGRCAARGGMDDQP